MVQPINSAERFFDPVVTAGAAPKHTAEGHEHCAYYNGQEVPGDFRIECEHGEPAWGGFYSEDFMMEIRVACHQLIAEYDRIVRENPSPLIENLRELTR